MKKIEEYIVKLLFACLYAGCLSYANIYFIKLPFPVIWIGISIPAVILYFSLFFYSRKFAVVTLSLTVLGAGAYLYYLSFHTPIGEISAKILHFIIWSLDFCFSGKVPAGGSLTFTYILGALISFSCALFAYWFSVKVYNFYLLLAMGTLVFVSEWLQVRQVNTAAFYTFLVIIVLAYFRHVFERKKGESSNEYIRFSRFIIYILPLSCILVGYIASLPKSDIPIQWPWMDEKINKFYDRLNGRYSGIKYDYFSFAETGFGEQGGKLGGRVTLDDTVVMEVEATRGLYLRGRAYDTYTGFSWINSKEDPDLTRLQASELNDLEEWKTGWTYLPEYWEKDDGGRYEMLPTEDSITDYSVYRNVRVTFRDLRTKSLFFPLKYSEQINISNKNELYIDSQGIITQESFSRSNYSYSFWFYDPDYKSEQLKEKLNKSENNYYSFLAADYQENESAVSAGLLTLMDNAQNAYSQYLGLPDSVPERVYELANRTVEGCTSQYEQVKALESYLTRNYSYTLSPETLPEGREFSDYFLFDEKQGYCTYFATSMCVLSRCLGIPSRYVEGFVLPGRPDRDGKFYVKNSNAHAWTEIYFEGFGWIPFEPTSPFMSIRYADVTFEGAFSPEFYMDPSMQDYLEELMENYYAGQLSDIDTSYLYQEKVEFNWWIVILILFGILILLAGFYAVRNRIRWWLWEVMKPEKAVVSLYNYYLKILSIAGVPIASGETPHEYAIRIDSVYVFDSMKFKLITEAFTRVGYGDKSMDEDSYKDYYGAAREINMKILKEMPPVKRYLMRYVVGRIK